MLKKYIILIVILAALVLVWIYQDWIFAGLDKIKNPNQELKELQLKNQGLEQEVAELRNKLELSSHQPLLAAQVFSRYPFNDNQSLIIDLGSRAGVKAGWPVLVAENHLLGKVVGVKTDTSEIKTIFSADWRSAIRISPSGIEALLVGGRQPILELIPADAKINLDDEVVSASPDLPLNLFIGRVGEINYSPAASLQQAKLKIDYNPNQIRKVFIITDHEGSD